MVQKLLNKHWRCSRQINTPKSKLLRILRDLFITLLITNSMMSSSTSSVTSLKTISTANTRFRTSMWSKYYRLVLLTSSQKIKKRKIASVSLNKPWTNFWMSFAVSQILISQINYSKIKFSTFLENSKKTLNQGKSSWDMGNSFLWNTFWLFTKFLGMEMSSDQFSKQKSKKLSKWWSFCIQSAMKTISTFCFSKTFRFCKNKTFIVKRITKRTEKGT